MQSCRALAGTSGCLTSSVRRIVFCKTNTKPCDISTKKTVVKRRDEFSLPVRFDRRRWFPMHMSVQMKKMEGKLRSVDLIIEVHDSRIPLTGRNQMFSQLYGVRPHILIFNKMDLIDLRLYRKLIEDYYYERGVKLILWTDCKTRMAKALRDVQKAMIECLRSEARFNRTVKTEYQVMVIGIPNVGKSSLINSMRNTNLGNSQNAVVEGARPGMTVRVQNRVRILDRPAVYVLDTPGILSPNGQNIEEAMKLGLCNLIMETATSPFHLADYLLYWLNKTDDHSYVDLLSLQNGPSDQIMDVLVDACKSNDMRMSLRFPGGGIEERWDIDGAANKFVKLYRDGKLKDNCLDKDLFK